jgi:transposase-like protein
MSKRRTFTPEFKTERVLEVLTGEFAATDVSRAHLLQPQQLSEWKAEFLANAPLVFRRGTDADAAQVRIAELEQLVGRLTLELEAVKKVSRYSISLSRRNGRS